MKIKSKISVNRKRSKQKVLFIFDLDGTLVDAYSAIDRSLNFTRKRLGYPSVGRQKARKSVGGGDKKFIKIFFRQEDEKKALAIYRNHHKKSLLKFSKLKPKARKLLYTLKRRNKILAIASNRPRPFTGVILNKLGIKKYFDIVLCADQIKALKPNPKILNIILKKFKVKREKAIYAGDMLIDLETAKRAKIDVIFVKGGSNTLGDAKKYKNKEVVSSLTKILKLYS